MEQCSSSTEQGDRMELRVAIEDLQAKGDLLVKASNEQHAQLATLATQSDPAASLQSGAAARYQDAFNRWQTSQQQMLNALQEMGQFLGQAASAYQAQDEAIMRALGL